ncbi:hypothetical protein [Streptomyces sp. NPDC101393]|uniref:hypothetical protein n=1 Tax=Streptomyces sp. NPDC101393 TaxID=3366141 RepID=UPI003803B4B9
MPARVGRTLVVGRPEAALRIKNITLACADAVVVVVMVVVVVVESGFIYASPSTPRHLRHAVASVHVDGSGSASTTPRADRASPSSPSSPISTSWASNRLFPAAWSRRITPEPSAAEPVEVEINVT